MTFKEDKFNKFVDNMIQRMIDHDDIYGETWKTENIAFLQQRLKLKMNEFTLTKNSEKLVSLANLAMILSVRMENKNEE
jgi:hypothetical protein